MDKKQALKILIENSSIINQDIKKELLENIDTMSEKDIDDLGRLLAKEMEFNVEDNEEFARIVEEVTREV